MNEGHTPAQAQDKAKLSELLTQRRHREALALAEELRQQYPENTELADLVTELRATNHWSMLPLWPMNRFGWVGAVVIWGAAIVGLQLARSTGGSGLSGALGGAVLVYIIYSWWWPGTLKKMLRR